MSIISHQPEVNRSELFAYLKLIQVNQEPQRNETRREPEAKWNCKLKVFL